MRCLLLVSMMLAMATVSSHTAKAADQEAKPPASPTVRVGVYDSRAVAYAHFWTDAQQEKRKTMIAEVTTAKQQGDQKKLDELKASLQEGQRQIHRRVFSTAPIDDVLAEIKDRLPAIEKQAGVSALVSKWDEKGLKPYAKAEQVDVTDLLVNEFKPTEAHRKVIESIRKAKPISLEQADHCD